MRFDDLFELHVVTRKNEEWYRKFIDFYEKF